MDYITSDTHFFHNNICGPEAFVVGRSQFPDAETMNQVIVTNHNNLVKKTDTVYHLGDISLNVKPAALLALLIELNGHFYFIKGNHDTSRQFKYLLNNNYELSDGKLKFLGMEEVGLRIKANKRSYFLSHYPIGLGERRAKMRNLCGHIHDDAANEANVLNVGVDSPEIGERPFGEPVPLEEAFALVDAKWDAWKAKTKRLMND